MYLPNTQYPEVGVCVANGVTGGTSNAWAISQYMNNTTFSAHRVEFTLNGGRVGSAGNELAWQNGDVVRLRLLCDGTNLHYQSSQDGFHWQEWYVEACPTVSYYGFFVGAETGSGTGSSQSQAMVYRNDLTTLTEPQLTVNAASNASPIVVGTTTNHNLQDGDIVSVHNVTGNTNANSGTSFGNVGSTYFGWIVHVLSATTFQLVGSTGNAPWVSGGVVTLLSR